MVTAAALAATLALGASGCGLLETNDDEIEQLRSEIIQLREDMIDLQLEVSVLASAPPQTTAPSSATTTTTTAPGTSDTTTTTEAAGSSDTTTTTAPTATEAPTPAVDEEAVLAFVYEWGPSEEAALLQTLLGITADGWYGPGTQAAHIAELEARGLPTDDVPNSPPTTTTTTLPPTTTVAVEGITEPDDSALDDYGSGQAGGIAYGGDDDCAYGDYDCLSTESGSVALAMSVFFTLTLLGGMGMMAWQALRREEDSTWV